MDYPQTILAWAMLYRKLNWSVVPVGLGTKFPLIEWAPYQQRLPTAEEVYEWFEGGGVGIGVVTGKVSNLTVIDNDSYKPQAVKLKLTTPLEAISGKGGRHYFFAYNPKIQTFKNEEKCVDARSEGGFIVLTPTVHPDTGKEYMWLGDSPTKEIIKNLPQAPDALEGYNSSLPGQSLDLDKLIGTAEGGRDENLYRFACRLIAHEGLSPEVAYQDLLILNATFEPPLPESVVREKLASAIKWKSGKLREEKEEKEKSPHGGREEEKAAFVFEPAWIEELPPGRGYEWIWEDFWAKGHITLISAKWKSGKSTMIGYILKYMYQEADNNFASRDLFPVPVLYISEETQQQWGDRRDELNLHGFQVICRPLRRKLSPTEWAQHCQETAQYCIESGIGGVIYDSLSRFLPLDEENSATQMNAALTPLNHYTEKNIGVLLVHHTTKGTDTDPTTSFRGSGDIGAFVDQLISFSRLPGETEATTMTNKRMLRSIGRFSAAPELLVVELTDEGYIVRGDSIKEATGEAKKEEKALVITDILREYSRPLTITEIRAGWDISLYGPVPSERTLQRDLAELNTLGRVERLEDLIARPQGGTTRVYKFQLKSAHKAHKDLEENGDFTNPPLADF